MNNEELAGLYTTTTTTTTTIPAAGGKGDRTGGEDRTQ